MKPLRELITPGNESQIISALNALPAHDLPNQEELDNCLLLAAELEMVKLIPPLIRLGADPKTMGNQACIWGAINKRQQSVKELCKYYNAEELNNIYKSCKNTLDTRLQKRSEEECQDILRHLSLTIKAEINRRIHQSLESKQKETCPLDIF
jgi:hypothetical protein